MSKVLLPKNDIEQKLDRSTLDSSLVKKYQDEKKSTNKGNDSFIIMDGPPYANGELHIGHLLNKTLKDFYLKRKLYEGYDVTFDFLSDCHGLPIEKRAITNLNKEGLEISDSNIMKYSKDISNHFSTNQANTLSKFGIFGDKHYRTSDEKYISNELEVFNTLLEKDYIYKENKPTWYSPTLNTVLANSEIEYTDLTENSLYFLLNCGEYDLLVWTTTEWTVKGNQAVCMNPEINYVLHNNTIMSERFAIENNLDVVHFDINSINEYTNHNGETCPIIKSNYALDTQTGIVHLCGGHGDDDFIILKENNIVPKNVCELSELTNHINSFVVDEQYVYKREMYTHSYPIDWSSKEKVYKVLTLQTYVRLDFDKIKIALKDVKLSSKDRTKLGDMLFSRKEWCISRQRTWGVKIPNEDDILDVWFDSGCAFKQYDEPADLYIEGVDQFRGWFQSSLILSSMVELKFTKRILSHGFVNNSLGEKFSKSLGNYTSLDVLYDKYNPDVLRLWVFLSSYKYDVTLSDESLDNAGKQYFKLRNYLRYFYNNIYGDYEEHKKHKPKHLVSNFDQLKEKVSKQIDEYDLSGALRSITDELMKYSSSLTENVKNEFYESDINSDFRINLEREFVYVLEEMLELLFPFIPFLYTEFKEKKRLN